MSFMADGVRLCYRAAPMSDPNSAAQPIWSELPPAAEAMAALRSLGRGEASHLVFAPGRVNLIGEHTDYNRGFVLPMAIDRGVFMAARPLAEPVVRLWSTSFRGECAEFRLDGGLAPGEPAWSNYVRGVLAGLVREGFALPGCEAVIHADLPGGGGLSSSAALEVAVATLGEALAGRQLDPATKALLCQRAEHEFAGVPCGIMDQFAVVMGRAGHLLLIDCQSQQTKHVPMPGHDTAFLVINTMVRHELSDGGYRARRDDCFEAARIMGLPDLRHASPEILAAHSRLLPERLFRRARHVISENARTLAAVDALERSAWPELGRLMVASHGSLRDDFEVSCPELDAVVHAAERIGLAGGVYGCRMTGGGFGGCCVALVAAAQADAIAARIAEDYLGSTGIRPVLFITKPSDGPRILLQP